MRDVRLKAHRTAVLVVALLLTGVVGLAWWTTRTTSSGAFPAVSLDGERALPQGDFVVGAFPEPAHLDPFTNLDPVVATWVFRLTHDTLCTLDPVSGRVRPALAQRIEAMDGGLRIDLRPDARFCDGTPVTADDVAFSHACARAPGLPGSAMVRAAGMVEALAVLGPHTLHARSLHPHWAARDVFTTGLLVLSRAAIEQRLASRAQERGVAVPTVDAADFATWLGELSDAGPGSGPYMLPEVPSGSPSWARGQHLDLVQNPYAWHRRASPLAWNVAGFRQVFVTERAAQVALARADGLDWLEGDVRALIEADARLRARFRVVVYDPFALGHFMVVWNCRAGPLADARVRCALAMLFDRAAIVRDVLAGDGVPAAAWFKPGSPELPHDVVPPRFDVALAKALLAEAGYASEGLRPLRIEIIGAAQEPKHRRILELVQPAFAAAGVELVPQLVEAGVLRQRLQTRAFAGLLAVKYHPDPWIDPWPYFHSSQAGSNGQNWMGLQDPEIDRCLDAARAANGEEERVGHLQAFCRRADALQPVALLVHPRAALLLHRRFEDAEVGVAGLSPERWWVKPQSRLHR